ncbi:hypothetical protein KY311_02815 [Candidatus Woesearchaeota archaeon]|nr:hypothetical protein [Candidatus Woesearchaeota archaeon]
MESKNFKNGIKPKFRLEPEMNLQMVEQAEQLLNLRMVDSSVISLLDERKKQVKELFDKRLF